MNSDEKQITYERLKAFFTDVKKVCEEHKLCFLFDNVYEEDSTTNLLESFTVEEMQELCNE